MSDERQDAPRDKTEVIYCRKCRKRLPIKEITGRAVIYCDACKHYTVIEIRLDSEP